MWLVSIGDIFWLWISTLKAFSWWFLVLSLFLTICCQGCRVFLWVFYFLFLKVCFIRSLKWVDVCNRLFHLLDARFLRKYFFPWVVRCTLPQHFRHQYAFSLVHFLPIWWVHLRGFGFGCSWIHRGRLQFHWFYWCFRRLVVGFSRWRVEVCFINLGHTFFWVFFGIEGRRTMWWKCFFVGDLVFSEDSWVKLGYCYDDCF